MKRNIPRPSQTFFSSGFLKTKIDLILDSSQSINYIQKTAERGSNSNAVIRMNEVRSG